MQWMSLVHDGVGGLPAASGGTWLVCNVGAICVSLLLVPLVTWCIPSAVSHARKLKSTGTFTPFSLGRNWNFLTKYTNVQDSCELAPCGCRCKMTWQPTVVMSNRGNSNSSKFTTKRRLIIDGSNGPLYLDRTCLNKNRNGHNDNDESKIHKHIHLSVSLLHVLNGASKGKRIHIVPRLDRLLAHGNMFESVTIFFDGLGKKTIANQSWDLSPHIKLDITNVTDEADDVIVELVLGRKYETLPHRTTPGSGGGSDCHLLGDLLQKRENSMFTSSIMAQDYVYTITRTSDGPGKSRNVLKYLQLLRRESVFCMFGFIPDLESNAVRVAKQLLGAKKLIHVKRQHFVKDATVVVSDDVLLRQRVVDSGGFVMTFEQMWDLLNSAELD